MSKAVCQKCGRTFEPDRWSYCGEDFCPRCIDKPRDAVIAAEKEAYEQYRNMGLDREEADRKARYFAAGVERKRRENGR